MKPSHPNALLCAAALLGSGALQLAAPATASAGWFEDLFGGGSTSTPAPTWDLASSVAGAGDPQSAAVALDDYGDGIGAWQDGDGSDVWVRHYSAGTGWVGSPMLLAPADAGAYDEILSDVQVAMNPSGDAIVAWVGRTVNPLYGNPDILLGTIWVSHYRVGEGFSAPEAVNYDPARGVAEVDQFDVAIDADGDAMVVYADDGAGSDAKRVWAARYTSGSGWSAVAQVSSATNANGRPRPRLAMASSGDAIVAWQNCPRTALGGSTCSQILARRSSAASGWGAILSVATTNYTLRENDYWLGGPDSHEGAGVDVALSPNGRGVIVYREYSSKFATDQIRAVTEGSSGWGSSSDISNTTSFFGLVGAKKIDVGAPELGVDASGKITVVWAQGPAASSSDWLVSWGIWTNRWASSWGTSSQIGGSAAKDGYEDPPALEVSVSPDGDAVAAWQHHVGNGDYAVDANFYFGGSWKGAQEISAGPKFAASPAVAIDAEGHALALWCEPGVVMSNRLE